MAKPLAPVHLIDEVLTVEPNRDQAILTLGSHGAEIRLSLSRHNMLYLMERLRRAYIAMEAVARDDASQVVAFPQTRRA